MEYKVLYRKYRPNNFDELVGQNHIKQILKNSIINDKIAHAYIFTGPRGTGKTSTAKIFAKTLNCTDIKDGICCDKCTNCVESNNSPDILEMDAASNNSVDDIREIIENISIAPTNSKYKIYIIDEVHMLTTQAWNAFLKTLEEPPSNVIFILATTDIDKVPITVLSRCQRFDFQRIDKNLIFDNLASICKKEKIKYEDDALSELAYLSDGCMRDALSILDQLSKVSDVINIDCIKENYGTVTESDIDDIYQAIIKNDIELLTSKLIEIKQTGIDIKILINKLQDSFIGKAVSIKKNNISSNAFKQIKNIINSLNELLYKLNSNSNGYLLLELELISFINDENNSLTYREVDQIISREIIKFDTKVDVNKMIKEEDNSQKYKVCDEFIDIRVNNSFVDCSKQLKSEAVDMWNQFCEYVREENKKEFLSIIKSSYPQVANKQNILMVAPSETIKIVANSKLFDLESVINTKFNNKYKLIFLSKKDWDKYLKNYDKNKVFEIMDESEYINDEVNSVSLAEEIFGNENINID